MSKRKLALTTVIGFGLGFAAQRLLNSKRSYLTPEDALEKVKATFALESPINGSWIYLEKEEYKQNDLSYQTYRGGVTREIDGTNIPYEFIADAATGTILHAERSDI